MEVNDLNTVLNVAQLAAFVIGGAVAVVLTMQRLTEIRDALVRQNGRIGRTEQRVSKIEGRMGIDQE